MSAIDLIIARGFDPAYNQAYAAGQTDASNLKSAEVDRKSAEINQQGALINQQSELLNQQNTQQDRQAAEASGQARMDLLKRAEALNALPQNDPNVQAQWRQLALEYEGLQSGGGKSIIDIVQPQAPKSQSSLGRLKADLDAGLITPQEYEAAARKATYIPPSGGGQPPKPPSGYTWQDPSNPAAGVVPLPGGPADPQAPGGKSSRDRMALRKEFRNLQSVKDYETALPLLVSARNAPDTPAGDLQVIYTVGKVLDPGSVVREGELQLTKDAAPWLQQQIGEARKQLDGRGALTPGTRASLLDALNQRVLGYRQAYDRDYGQYASYAQQSGYSPLDVVGTHSANAYGKKKSGGKAADPLGIRGDQ